jgi:threonyl-tRNA synthetase
VIAVVGRKEAEGRQLALRRLGSDRQSFVGLDEAARALALEALPPDLAPAKAETAAALEPA